MRCPSCRHDNPEGVKFCGECGTSLQAAAACPRCGSSNPEGVKFCHECGQRLVEPAPAPPTPTPAPSPALPTSLAAGRYQIKRFLGEGGKKRVYLAHDTRLDRDVAFSVIKTEGLDASGLARVRREAGVVREPLIITTLAGQTHSDRSTPLGKGGIAKRGSQLGKQLAILLRKPIRARACAEQWRRPRAAFASCGP